MGGGELLFLFALICFLCMKFGLTLVGQWLEKNIV